jgi:hypothetical protein
VRRSLYKYFSEQKHAEAFVSGEMLFRSLAYFRDYEDAVRGDQYEGTSNYRPVGGLVVNNLTQGTTFTLQMAFESSVRAKEIFVYCVSRTLSKELAEEFGAVVCVEIKNPSRLCARIEAALPPTATFKARRVDYYSSTEVGSRWALPDDIATSKLDDWRRQDEFRFIFSFTDALGFEKIECRLIDRKNRPTSKTEEHIPHLFKLGSLSDICILHDVGSSTYRK